MCPNRNVQAVQLVKSVFCLYNIGSWTYWSITYLTLCLGLRQVHHLVADWLQIVFFLSRADLWLAVSLVGLDQHGTKLVNTTTTITDEVYLYNKAFFFFFVSCSKKSLFISVWWLFLFTFTRDSTFLVCDKFFEHNYYVQPWYLDDKLRHGRTFKD